ncbi:putative pilin [Calothrix parasitica NIES-267]|uniref:Putative pilin n=1 Tax=Calothrix parasitica NIES-267 TaxID=1973488 RepID=A0A1Z4M0N4_9CYAN|nr:putative pilin [Calothrix parasitica NIES-267]
MKKNISSESFLLTRKLITAALLLLVSGISGCESSTNAQSSRPVTWTGEWELKDPRGTGKSMKVILTPQGKAYFIPPQSPYSDKVAYDIPLEKVSNRTTLPAGTEVIPLGDAGKKQADRERNKEAKVVIGAMNRAQQAHYIENAKFSTEFNKLGLGISKKTEHYAYKIVSQSSKSVMNIGQAKRRGLSSYIGLVYLTKTSNGETITLAKICETSQILSRPPRMPRIPRNSSEEIKCPRGFIDMK